MITEARWMGIGKPAAAALETALRSWERTPYQEGQRARRIGVDCFQLVGGVFDQLFKMPAPTILPPIRNGAAYHDIKNSREAVRALLRGWHGLEVVRTAIIMPGDVILTRATGDPHAPPNPAHCLIAGSEKWTAYHALRLTGVVKTTLAITWGIVRIYRPRKKELWVSR